MPKPFLKTPWQPDDPIPLPEYPRPQMARDAWMNLNGWWEYAVQPSEVSEFTQPQGKILVPYPLESQLSGVQRQLNPGEALWYRREVHLEPFDGKRMLLHFGAVDHECRIWMNGVLLGEHVGGYLPFSFDVSAAVRAGTNELVVRVLDPTNAGRQQTGKQVLEPSGIWYTAISGIWQTVWLETVNPTYIESLRLTPRLTPEPILAVVVNAAGTTTPLPVRLIASFHTINISP